MSLSQFDYVAPVTVGAAVDALQEPGAVAMGGGHHLLTKLKRRETTVGRLVDLGGVPELRGTHLDAHGAVVVGAMTTLTALLRDPVLHGDGPLSALDDAASVLGDRQSRNRVTVGAQLASGRCGNDLVAALMALDSVVTVVGPSGARQIRISDGWDGPRLTLERGELVTAVIVPLHRWASGYTRMVNRPTLEAVCGVAASVRLRPDGLIDDCRIAAVGATVTPRRFESVEDTVRGTDGSASPGEPPTDETMIDDHAASEGYRRYMTGVLTERALGLAMTRARVPIGD